MGLFAPQPEDPTEWAGLPSEPLRPRDGAEHLDDIPPGIDLLGAAPAGVAWVAVPMPEPEGSAPDGDDA